MKDRIEIIMKEEGLSSAKFAKEINVNPASISHILSGRNNPSTDLLINILNRFVWVNSEWLLMGKGSRYKTQNGNISTNFSENQNGNIAQQASLFTEDNFKDPINPSSDDFSANNLPEKPISSSQTENFNISKENMSSFPKDQVISSKEIVKIVIFYSDNTFDLYKTNN